MKRLIMPLLAVLLAFAFWPTFADTATNYASYATTSLDADATDAMAAAEVAPVPPAVTGDMALNSDNLDSHSEPLSAMGYRGWMPPDMRIDSLLTDLTGGGGDGWRMICSSAWLLRPG